MKRISFYKEYYEITNRLYADRIIWTAKDRERAWHKGQINTSKTERGIFITAQYFILATIGALFATENTQYGIIGCVMFWLSSLITDFSITKIEILYRIFSYESPCAMLLYQAFLGKADNLGCLILPETKKKVSGLVRTNRNKFVAKYRVIFRKKQEDVTIIISPFRIRLKSKTRNIVINDTTATLIQIANRVSEVLNTL